MIKHECIIFEKEVINSSQAIELLGNSLYACGAIKREYVDSTIEREIQFPTGLEFATISIAIPHSSANGNVQKNSIAMLKATKGIKFKSMAGYEPLSVNIVFLLALKDGKKHLEVLSKFMTIFQDNEFVKKLKASEDKYYIEQLIKAKMEE